MIPTIELDLLSTRLIENGESSLAESGLAYADIEQVVETQVDERDDILLTSSSVQGLATPKSDIDIICITKDELQSDRAASQIFHKQRRFEVMLFSSDEVIQSIEYLDHINAADFCDTIAALRQWDRKNIIRFKYFERLVNGVSFNHTTPYIRLLPKLAEAWRVLSYDNARQFVIYTMLAIRAGQERSAAVYSLKAIAQLMDVTLTCYGSVYTNPKWYALRWARFVQQWPSRHVEDELVGAIDKCWVGVRKSFELGSLKGNLAEELLKILLTIESRCGFNHFWTDASSIFGHKGILQSYGGDDGLWLDPASTMIIAPEYQSALVPIKNISAIAQLDKGVAATLLRAARAKLVDFSLSAQVV